MLDFIYGAVVFGYLTAALFFLRFWKVSKDKLFAYFASAFLLLGVQRVALTFSEQADDATFLYLVRLCAFLLILYGIYKKNAESRRTTGSA
jgi:peptidoglycan/LPS O-acetylase OafA/YrhL